MNDFSNAPIIRLRGCAPVHHVDDQAFCAFCWGKRFVLTNLCDDEERPICAECAARSERVQMMPSFMLRDLMGIVQ